LQARGDEADGAAMPGAEVPGWGEAEMRTRLPLIALAIALAVSDSLSLAAPGSPPVGGDDTDERV